MCVRNQRNLAICRFIAYTVFKTGILGASVSKAFERKLFG